MVISLPDVSTTAADALDRTRIAMSDARNPVTRALANIG
jgi:hypothetical protein